MSNHTDPNQLPVYDITQHNILYTDTFKEWADKCNAVIDVLNRTDFLVAEELTNELTNVVFKNGDFVNGELVPGAVQIISAPKTFDAVTNFEDDVIFGNLADVTFKDSVTFEDNNLIKDTGSLTVEGPSIFWNEIAIKQDTEHGISEQTIGYRANDEKYTRLISSAPFEVPKLIVTGNFVELNSIHYELPDDSYGNDNETKYGNNETDGRVYYLKNIGTKLAGDIFEEDGEINGGPTTSNNLIWQKDLSSMSFSPEHNIEYYGPDGELKDSFFVPDRNATSLDCTNIEIPAPPITENLQPEGLPEDFIPKDGHIHIEIWAAPIPLGKCVTSNSCIDNVSEDECLLIGGIWSLEQSCIAGSFDITKDYNQRPAGLSPLRLIGEAIRFTIAVTNPGDLPLTNVIVSDSILPEYRENISGNTGLFTGTTLSPRQTKTISYDYIVTYDDAVLGLPIINNAYVTGSPNQETPIYIDTPIFVNDIGGLPDLTINKTHDPPNNGSNFIVGEAITYHISVTNDGDNIARDVIITDAMTRDIDSTTGDIELFVGGSDIAGGETKTVSYEHTILESEYNNLPLSNGACVDSYSVDGQPVEISYPTSTLCTPDVEINNILNIGTFDVGLEILGQLTIDNELALDNSPPYIVGEDAIFEVEIINTGLNDLSNVTLSIFEDTAGEWIAGNHITVLEDDDDLFTDGISRFEPGRIATVRYSYQITQADAGNGITNRAKVQTDQGEIDSNPVVIADGDITLPAPSSTGIQLQIDTTAVAWDSPADDTQFRLATRDEGTFDASIDWGDGTSDVITTWDDPALTHDYSATGGPGTYIITVTGQLGNIYFNHNEADQSYPDYGIDKNKVIQVLSWGDASNPINLTSAFHGCYNLTNIPNGPIPAWGLTDFSSTFKYNDLTSIPANLFANNPGVTTFNGTFYSGLSDAITSIPAGLFDNNTAVTDFSDTFRNSAGLTSIPAGLFDNNINVTHFSGTFKDCYRITSIPAGLFDNNTAVTDFSDTFHGCGRNPGGVLNTGLTEIPAGLFDNNTAVTTFRSTFSTCRILTSIPAGLFDNNTIVEDFIGTFGNCGILTSIPAGLFDNNTAVTDFSYTFWNCDDLASIPAGLFDNNTAVTSFEYTFASCVDLTSIPANLFGSTVDASFRYTFWNCINLTSIPAGLFNNNTAVTRFDNTFQQCRSLTSIPAGLFDNNINVEWFSNTFADCDNLTSIPTGLFDNNTAVIGFSGTFNGGQRGNSLTSIPAGLFDNNINVTNFNSAFEDCKSLTSIPTGLFDNNTAVRGFDHTFASCSLTSIPAGLFNNNTAVTNFKDVFYRASLTQAVYSNLLVELEANNQNDNVPLGASSTYDAAPSVAATARADLIADHGWSISDNGPA